MKIMWYHKTIASWRMMFGGVVSEISESRVPVYQESLLTSAIFDKMGVYINSLNSFDFNGRICETNYGWVINLYQRWWLRMANFLKHNAKWCWYLTVVGDTTNLSRWSHNTTEEMTFNVKCTIELRSLRRWFSQGAKIGNLGVSWSCAICISGRANRYWITFELAKVRVGDRGWDNLSGGNNRCTSSTNSVIDGCQDCRRCAIFRFGN